MATPKHEDAEIVRKVVAGEIPPPPRIVRFIKSLKPKRQRRR